MDDKRGIIICQSQYLEFVFPEKPIEIMFVHDGMGRFSNNRHKNSYLNQSFWQNQYSGHSSKYKKKYIDIYNSIHNPPLWWGETSKKESCMWLMKYLHWFQNPGSPKVQNGDIQWMTNKKWNYTPHQYSYLDLDITLWRIGNQTNPQTGALRNSSVRVPW